jgi:two-component system OmpR family sensor kinase
VRVVRRRVMAALVSIRTRLAVFFFLITLLAIGVVYIGVAPSLQSSLEKQKVADLTVTAQDVTSKTLLRHLAALPDDSRAADPVLEQLLAQTHADTVTLVAITTSANGSLVASGRFASGPATDSKLLRQYSLDAIQQPKKDANKAISAIVGSNLGLVAVPFAPRQSPSVFVFAVNFHDVHGDVVVIRRRILISAAIALFAVLLLGVLVARAITVRVLRLEKAAQAVASGDFTAHFEVDSHDELGQLAAALAHMQTQLQELEHARRRFIAIASHELRTPIFSLGGFLELIQDEELDEATRRQFVGQVREQVARLGKLATGLLDLSRLEAGSIDLVSTPTDLGVLSRAVAAEFGPALTARGSAIALTLPDEPLRVMCDPDRVAQLLRILIDNAITHTPTGTSVLVRVEPPHDDAGVRLSVTDDGPGVAVEAIDRIFEPFYSADGVQGAGLGLAIARELADRLRIELDVRSRDGETVFTLTLPAEEAER